MKNRKPSTEGYSILQCRLRKSVYKQLAHAAVDLNMSQVGIIEYLIEEYLEDILLNPPSEKRPEGITS